MSSESMLQKEFNGRDVQRMRNIITKNYGDKTTTQVGYTKEHIERKEGDIWEEEGRQWTVKNGIKMTISKLDILKKTMSLPLVCPSCKVPMKSSNANKKMWSIHKICLDCVLKMETKLKVLGTFDEYQRNMQRQGIAEYVKELEQLLLEVSMSNSNEDFVTEEGDVEKWDSNIDKHKIQQDIQEYIQKVKEAAQL
jgi:hypothetical protein